MQTLKRCAALCLISFVVLLACKKSPQADVNKPPVANAGPDQTLILPATSTQLIGSGTDSDGTIESYQWSSLESSGRHTLVTPANRVTNLTDLEIGQYRFSLKVTDNKGRSATDDVIVSVLDSTRSPWDY